MASAASVGAIFVGAVRCRPKTMGVLMSDVVNGAEGSRDSAQAAADAAVGAVGVDQLLGDAVKAGLGRAAEVDEPLGEPGKAALVAEREARKTAEKELKALRGKVQEFEDRDKTELERAQAAVEAAARERDEATSALLRYEVAAEKGVPNDALPLLSGSTREELEAKADSILSLIKASKPGPVVPLEGKSPDRGTDVDQMARDILLG